MGVIPPIWRTRPATPEQRLAAAVLAQAYADMFGGAPSLGEPRGTVDTLAITAIRYLTDRHGLSAQWRNQWCSYLDLDGDILAERVRMILDGQLDPPGDAARLAIGRDRWARMSHRPPPKDKPPLTPPAAIDPHADPIIPDDPDGLIIPDDPFYVSGSGHIRASRQWRDGEVSRFLGPLPPVRGHLGDALWKITQAHRAGAHALHEIRGDGPSLIDALRAALPTCEIRWTSQGNRLPEYQPNAGLRVYLKQLAKAA